MKSRIRSLLHVVPGSTSINSIVGAGKKSHEIGNGVELKRVTPIRHVGSSSSTLNSLSEVSHYHHHHHHHPLIPPSAATVAFGREFPYLPEMHTGRVPDGHTAYSWFGKVSQEDDTCPLGHTNFSWNAASW